MLWKLKNIQIKKLTDIRLSETGIEPETFDSKPIALTISYGKSQIFQNLMICFLNWCILSKTILVEVCTISFQQYRHFVKWFEFDIAELCWGMCIAPSFLNCVFLVVSLKPLPHVTYVSSLIKFRIENITASRSSVCGTSCALSGPEDNSRAVIVRREEREYSNISRG